VVFSHGRRISFVTAGIDLSKRFWNDEISVVDERAKEQQSFVKLVFA
jgi:hypothetical protein